MKTLVTHLVCAFVLLIGAEVRAENVSSALNAPSGPLDPRPGTGAGLPRPYSVVRYDEDNTAYRDPARREDLLDSLKYIPLNASGDAYLSLGGSVRERYEYFRNMPGVSPSDPNGYYLTRMLASADLHLGPNVRGFLQLKSSMLDGREGGPRSSDADEFDLQQAFFDIRVPFGGDTSKDSFTLRAGRQELLYGVQRLIGPGDWTNSRRAFEGVKGILSTGTNQLDVFWVRPVTVEVQEPNSGDGNSNLIGVYDTLALPTVFGTDALTKLEMYGLVLSKNATRPVDTAPAVAADSETYTVGARFSTKPKPFDLDVEADYQFGEVGAGNIDAWAIAIEAGYTASLPLAPRFFLGFDFASGDDDPNNPDRQTFNQLYPTGHTYFGYIDLIGRQNIIDLHPGVDLTLLQDQKWAKKVVLRAEYHQFWRANKHDALYNSFRVVVDGSASDELSIGGEIDFLLNWQINKHLFAYLGYSHLFSGEFLSDTGFGRDIDFFYTAVQFIF